MGTAHSLSTHRERTQHYLNPWGPHTAFQPIGSIISFISQTINGKALTTQNQSQSQTQTQTQAQSQSQTQAQAQFSQLRTYNTFSKN